LQFVKKTPDEDSCEFLPTMYILNSWLLAVVDSHFGKKRFFFKFWAVVDKILYNTHEISDNASLTNLCDSDYTTRLRLVVQISHAFVNNVYK
jgi:hypothetical protein